jgi:hypothetical protein
MSSLKNLLQVKEREGSDDEDDDFARSMSFDLRKKKTLPFANTQAIESFAKKQDYTIEDGPPKVSASHRSQDGKQVAQPVIEEVYYQEPYLEDPQIQGDVYSLESYQKSSKVLQPIVFQEKINCCLNLLLEHCLSAASSKDIKGKFNQIKAAMDVLNYLFYEEFDGPGGVIGSFTVK